MLFQVEAKIATVPTTIDSMVNGSKHESDTGVNGCARAITIG